MPPRRDTVSFLSDYGLADEFVGVVRGVIRTIAPHVAVIDLCHEIEPHDVGAGALLLARSVQYLPSGVVLAVVDPGVGTTRRAVAVEVDDTGGPTTFVGPDNGLLAPAVAMAGGATRAVSLTNETYHLPAPGPTFAGRDVFAPAAAHLCAGVDLDDLGESIDSLSLQPGILPLTRVENGKLIAQVLWVDRFGNVQLNAGPEDISTLGERVAVRYREEVRTAIRVTTYDDAGPGDVALLVDSYGLLSLAVARGSAAEALRLHAGDAVTLEEAT